MGGVFRFFLKPPIPPLHLLKEDTKEKRGNKMENKTKEEREADLENISTEICILAKQILKALPEPKGEQVNFKGVL